MRGIAWLSRGLPALLLVAACSGGGGGNNETESGGATETDSGSTGSTSGSTGSGPTTGDSATGSTGSGTTTGDTDSTTTGSTTGGPMCPNPQPEDGMYSECNDDMWFCAGGGFCLQDMDNTFGVCSRGCIDVCNCWPKPTSGDAEPACSEDISQGNNGICVLDCSGGRTCPTGMMCDSSFQICVFPDMGSGTGTGTGTSG